MSKAHCICNPKPIDASPKLVMIEIQKLQLLTLVAIADAFTFVEQGKKRKSECTYLHTCVSSVSQKI